jgi:RNA polymerase sigma-70 factor (ECF subfamily)
VWADLACDRTFVLTAGAPVWLMGGVSSDEELMAAWVRGDAAAFRQLFDRYAPVLLRLLRRGLWREEEARDLLQQTFLHVHRARHDFRPGARLRPWIMTIALNLKREHLRSVGRKKENPLELDGTADPVAPELEVPDAETAQKVQKALAQLPEGQREVIQLHWWEGLTYPEIGEALGASTIAVRVRAHRGYETLRKLLAAEKGGGRGAE